MTARDELVGQILGDTYRIARLIGRGGMGSVYEAMHVRLSKRRFAVKVLHPRMAADPTLCARFRREAEIATELRHRHIIDVVDFNKRADGQPYIVMDYLEGQDLSSQLAQDGPWPVERAIELMRQVGEALDAAHEKRVVHRDLKPENIFLVDGQAELEAKVLDFGISKIVDGRTSLTADFGVMGTPHYMSPEQASGVSSDVDHKSDIFALGAICYEMLTGEPPFDAPSVPATLYKICHQAPPPLDESLAAVGAVIARALAKSKSDRYERAAQFVADLEKAASAPASPAATPTPSTPSLVQAPTSVMSLEEALYGDADAPRESTAAADSAVEQTDDATLPPLQDGCAPLTGAPGNSPSRPRMTTLSSATAEKLAPAQIRAPRSRWSVAVAAGTVVALCVVGLTLWRAGGNRHAARAVSAAPKDLAATRTPDSASDSASAAPSPSRATRAADSRKTSVDAPDARLPSNASSGSSITVRLKLRPKNARVYLDGKLQRGNTLHLHKREAARTVEVVARGYVRARRRVVLLEDQTLTYFLQRRVRMPKSPPLRRVQGHRPQVKPKRSERVYQRNHNEHERRTQPATKPQYDDL